MDKLKLPAKSHKGLTIYCSTDKQYLKKGEKTLACKCGNFDRQKYRLRISVPGGNGQKVSTTFETRNYNEAVIQSIKYEELLRANNFHDNLCRSNNKVEITANISIRQAAEVYSDFLNNIGVYAQSKKDLSPAYIKSIEKKMKDFLYVLKGNMTLNVQNKMKLKPHNIKPKIPGYNIDTLSLNDIDASHVEMIHYYLEEHYGKKIYNNYTSSLRTWFRYFREEHGIIKSNPFMTMKHKKIAVKKNIISKAEFDELLESIGKANQYQEINYYSETKGENVCEIKNHYSSYLKDAITFAFLTGQRREGWATAKFSDIIEGENGIQILIIDNYKVQRILNDENVEPAIIPIYPELRDFLNKMGWEEHKGEDRYIIHPSRIEDKKGARPISAKTMYNNVSKAFSHYWKSLNKDYDRDLNVGRKVYLTRLKRIAGKNTHLFSSHKGMTIIDKHYIDPKVMNKVATKMGLW